jgi:hypothetical protein
LTVFIEDKKNTHIRKFVMKDQTIELRTSFNLLSQSLDEQHIQLKNDIDQWHSNLIERIENMYLNTLIELDTSYERLETFQQTLYVLLDDERLIDKTGSNSFRLFKKVHFFFSIFSSDNLIGYNPYLSTIIMG